MNALDAALIKLNHAAQPLERAKPTFTDVEAALEKATEAVKILKGAKALLEESIFQVAEEPPGPGTPLPFDEPKAAMRRAVQDIADSMEEGESMGISVPDGPTATIHGTGKRRRA